MVMDGPVIDYGSGKKGLGNSPSDVRDMDALSAAWSKRQSQEGSKAGQTFSLDGYLREEM